MNSSKKKKAVSSTNESSEVESSTGTVMTRNNDLPTLKKHSKRKHWTESEDNQLRQVVSEFTQTNQRTSYARSFTTANAGSNSRTKSATNSIEWVKIAEKMGGDRSGKQCRGKCTENYILFLLLCIKFKSSLTMPNFVIIHSCDPSQSAI